MYDTQGVNLCLMPSVGLKKHIQILKEDEFDNFLCAIFHIGLLLLSPKEIIIWNSVNCKTPHITHFCGLTILNEVQVDTLAKIGLVIVLSRWYCFIIQHYHEKFI